MTSKTEIMLYLLAMLLVVIGGLNWGSIGIFGKNLVEELNKLTFKNEWFSRSVYIIVAIAALYLLFKKHSFAPFKGPTVMPVDNMQFNRTYSDMSVRVDAPNAIGVVYWASHPTSVIGIAGEKNIMDSYDDYLSSGYVPIDSDGKATLFFQCSKSGGLNPPKKHIHYRLIYAHGENGGLNISEIRTVNVNCQLESE